MADSPLKNKLTQCAWTMKKFKKSMLTISHRGAPLMFPEHTLLGQQMAARMGAQHIECDVTFTKDRELVCRHDQCDLHTTTDVLLHPELAAKCTRDWSFPNPNPRCCTSDFTLAELKTVCAKMDAFDPTATTRQGYVNGGVPTWRTTLYSRECPRVPSHKEYIQNIKQFGAKYIPELKTPSGVVMPYNYSGVIFSQTDYAQKLVNEYIEAEIDPSIVYLQSFLWSDCIYWATKTDYKNALALEGNDDTYNWSRDKVKSWLQAIHDANVPFISPPQWMLANKTNATNIDVSTYASVALEMGFKIITWSFERDGPLQTGGGYYSTGLNPTRDGFSYEFLDFMVQKAKIQGIFSDWPASVTFYANCMNVGL